MLLLLLLFMLSFSSNRSFFFLVVDGHFESFVACNNLMNLGFAQMRELDQQLRREPQGASVAPLAGAGSSPCGDLEERGALKTQVFNGQSCEINPKALRI